MKKSFLFMFLIFVSSLAWAGKCPGTMIGETAVDQVAELCAQLGDNAGVVTVENCKNKGTHCILIKVDCPNVDELPPSGDSD